MRGAGPNRRWRGAHGITPYLRVIRWALGVPLMLVLGLLVGPAAMYGIWLEDANEWKR